MAAEAYIEGAYLKLYTNGQSVQSLKYNAWLPLARFINGEIVTVGRLGKLTVLNEKLVWKKYFKFYGTDSTVLSLAGNDKFIAYSDNDGVVLYYKNGDSEHRVSETSKVLF